MFIGAHRDNKIDVDIDSIDESNDVNHNNFKEDHNNHGDVSSGNNPQPQQDHQQDHHKQLPVSTLLNKLKKCTKPNNKCREIKLNNIRLFSCTMPRNTCINNIPA